MALILFLGLLVSVLIIKIIEKKRQIEDGLSNMLVLALCVAASVISAFGDAFILCTFINIFLLIPIGGAIVSSGVDKNFCWWYRLFLWLCFYYEFASFRPTVYSA
ncbi:hypothetical protein P4S68_21815 [Pseudoalteromonas sp. Hal099]